MNELTVNKNEIVSTENFDNLAIEYLKNMGTSLPKKYETQFVELCKAFSLNPFKRECYAISYGDKFQIITGYEVYIKRAERTGKLDGWRVELKGSIPNMSATITIYRKDWKMPFEHTVLFAECCQKDKSGNLNSVWKKQPSFMLKKVAIAQGFRLCFPDELGGMPYTSDELPQEEKNITNEATVKSVNENQQPQNHSANKPQSQSQNNQQQNQMFTAKQLVDAKLELEAFVLNGVLDNKPKFKQSAADLLQSNDYKRITDAISYCEKLSRGK